MSRWLIFITVLVTASCGSREHGFAVPTSPTTPTASAPAPQPTPPPSTPQPPPTFPPNSDVTSIRVGEVVTYTIGDSPSECIDFRGWPCQYFQLTAPRSGTLTIELMYAPETQPPGRTPHQGVDISLRGGMQGERWAEFGNETSTRLTARVAADTEYTIILWYTFPRLEYTLRTEITD